MAYNIIFVNKKTPGICTSCSKVVSTYLKFCNKDNNDMVIGIITEIPVCENCKEVLLKHKESIMILSKNITLFTIMFS